MGLRRSRFFLIFLLIGSCAVSAVEDGMKHQKKNNKKIPITILLVPGPNKSEEYTKENIILSFIIAFLKFVLLFFIFGAILVSFMLSLYHFSIKPWMQYGVDEVHHAQLGIIEDFVEFDEL
ncbi:unnamed protein product [Caenorhabditis brenneri]